MGDGRTHLGRGSWSPVELPISAPHVEGGLRFLCRRCGEPVEKGQGTRGAAFESFHDSCEKARAPKPEVRRPAPVLPEPPVHFERSPWAAAFMADVFRALGDPTIVVVLHPPREFGGYRDLGPDLRDEELPRGR